MLELIGEYYSQNWISWSLVVYRRLLETLISRLKLTVQDVTTLLPKILNNSEIVHWTQDQIIETDESRHKKHFSLQKSKLSS
jgi:predicted nucleic acid-binding protein